MAAFGGIFLEMSALLQESNRHGSPEVYVQPGLGDLQQSVFAGNRFLRGQKASYSAILTAKLGQADLTAVSGYNVNTYSNLDRLYLQLWSVCAIVWDYRSISVSDPQREKTSKFTQEARLSLPLDSGSIGWWGFSTRTKIRLMRRISGGRSH